MKKQIRIQEDILWDYIDGLLSEEEHTAVEAELARTPKWQAMLTKVQAEKAVLSATPLEQPQEEFAATLLNVWQQEQALQVRKSQQKNNLFSWIFGLMAVLLLLSIGGFVYGLIQSAGVTIALPISTTNLSQYPAYWYTIAFVVLGLFLFTLDELDKSKQKIHVQL